MADPKNAKLFVNLGASQARRRLKGFGHGVRKVETAGNNQALITKQQSDVERKWCFHRTTDHVHLPAKFHHWELCSPVGKIAADFIQEVAHQLA